MAFRCLFIPEIGQWALRENNALELANQSARYIGYKHNIIMLSKLFTANGTLQREIYSCVYYISVEIGPNNNQRLKGERIFTRDFRDGPRTIRKVMEGWNFFSSH